MNKCPMCGNGILTVGEMKKIIENLPDETQIIVGVDMPSEYLNIEQITIPDFDENFFLTLSTADTFDPRQF